MNRTTRRRFLQTGAAGAAALAVPIRFARAAKKGGVMRMGKAHGGTTTASTRRPTRTASPSP